MKKILNIVGARPQFIKAAAISRMIAGYFSNQIEEVLVHSGQHYDTNMSDAFFKELELPKPKYHFDIRSIPKLDHVLQMTKNIEMVIRKENPDMILLYGDTNTTLAGTHAASNLEIPIAHIEAGLRVFDNSLPEEYNRFKCDQASTLLFCPSRKAMLNLESEGFDISNRCQLSPSNPAVFFSGDVMFDSLLYAEEKIKHTEILREYNLQEDKYVLATIHRNFNTDDIGQLNQIFESLNELSLLEQITVVLPIHPRTKNQFDKYLDKDIKRKIGANARFVICDPLPYFETLSLLKNAHTLITDSGGMQKEAYWLETKSIVLRDSTEWTELVENEFSVLTDGVLENLLEAYRYSKPKIFQKSTNFYGDGNAAKFICQTIVESFKEIG